MSASKEAGLILRTDGTPFKSESTAKRQASLLAKEGIKTVPKPYNNGFALEKVSDSETPPPDTSLRQRPHRKRMEARNILDCESRPGYVRRWVLDAYGDGRRLQRFKMLGYDFVEDSKRKTKFVKSESEGDVGRASQLGSSTTRAAGGGQTLHLMEIPEEWYKEAQAEKAAEIDKIEATIQRKPSEMPDQDTGVYSPGGVQIGRR